MGYWMHVYSRTEQVMPRTDIEAMFDDDEIVLEWFPRDGDGWKQVCLSYPDDQLIALVDVHRLSEEPMFAEQLQEDIEAAREGEPSVNGEWVADFLAGVKIMYSFQIGSGVDEDDGWDYVHALQHRLCQRFDGILHAEDEGYSNNHGAHITWEFSDRVTGEWVMALFDPRSGAWTNFRMELGNPDHREAFRVGRVPDGVERLPGSMSFWG